MNYSVFLVDKSLDDAAFVDKNNDWGVADIDFRKNNSLQANFSQDAEYLMNKDEEEWRVLYDRVNTADSLLVVSEKFKDLLGTLDCGNIELLPVKIRDQRDALTDGQWFIVHTLEFVDYIDTEHSDYKTSPLKKDRILFIDSIVMKKNEIPLGRDLFRAPNLANVFVVSERFIQATKEKKLSGLNFIEISQYNSTKHGT